MNTKIATHDHGLRLTTKITKITKATKYDSTKQNSSVLDFVTFAAFVPAPKAP
jgi:hypothetical protein